MNTARRTKARLDNAGIASEPWIETDRLRVKQSEVCAAIGGLPYPKWWKTGSQANGGATCDGGHSANSASRADVHRGAVDQD